MRTRLAIISILLAHLGPVVDAAAEEPHARMRLGVEHNAAAPGQRTLLMLTYEIDEGWHLYWNGKNDTGIPIEPRITAPGSLETDDILWPAPERKVSPGDLLDHVYHDRVTLLWPVRIPEDAEIGTTLEIKIDADWLVCDAVCVLESGSATASVEIVPGDAIARVEGSDLKLLEDAMARIPAPGTASDDALMFGWDNDTLIIRAKGADAIRFYPAIGCPDLADPIGGATVEGNRLNIRFVKIDEDQRITGVVEIERDGSRSWREVRVGQP